MTRLLTFFATIFVVLAVGGCDIIKGGTGSSPTSPTDPVPPTTPTSKGLVSFAIDDGWRSTYNNAIPILDSAGYKSTNYIITGRFGNTTYVGASEVLSLQSRGHEIGAHTRSHQDLTLMTAVQAKNEVEGSRADLLGIGVRSVNTFTYPFGSVNKMALDAVRAAGFSNARTSSGGYNSRSTDRYMLLRQNLGNKVNIDHVKSWIALAAENDQWLILVMHHVDETDSEFSISPAFLGQIITLIKQKGIKVVTVSEGVQTLGLN